MYEWMDDGQKSTKLFKICGSKNHSAKTSFNIWGLLRSATSLPDFYWSVKALNTGYVTMVNQILFHCTNPNSAMSLDFNNTAPHRNILSKKNIQKPKSQRLFLTAPDWFSHFKILHMFLGFKNHNLDSYCRGCSYVKGDGATFSRHGTLSGIQDSQEAVEGRSLKPHRGTSWNIHGADDGNVTAQSHGEMCF